MKIQRAEWTIRGDSSSVTTPKEEQKGL